MRIGSADPGRNLLASGAALQAFPQATSREEQLVLAAPCHPQFHRLPAPTGLKQKDPWGAPTGMNPN